MESLLESLLPHWPGVVFQQRPDLSWVRAAGRVEEVTGCPPRRWENEPGLFWGLLHELDEEEYRRQLARAGQDGKGVHHRFRLRHARSGRVRHLAEFRRADRDGSGRVAGYHGFWLDLTDQTLAERRLTGAAWKETLGLLTLGLAHDFNNVLAGVLGLSESFLAQLPPVHPFREGLGLVKQKTHEAAQLIQRIAQLHRAKPGARGYHNLNDVLQESLELLRKVVPKRIEVSGQPDPSPIALYVDAVELQQVVLGLALNAADAMLEGGKLTLRTEQHPVLPPLGHHVGIAPRLPAACLAVRDTGTGIQPRLLPFVFDPFFTTKPMNRGSGLGLYSARLFVEKHQGAISVESQEGAGAVFRIWLPQADFTEADQALQLDRQKRRGLLLAGPPGRLLDSTAESLRQGQYLVVVGGAEAEDLLRSEDYSFDGVLLLVEPGDGRPLALARFIRLQKIPVRLVLKAVGSPADELPAELTRQADLVLSSELPEDAILERLAELFDARP
jgi:signal transduction histidine kinase